MCGIVGYQSFSKTSYNLSESLESATRQLKLRGPDFQDTYYHQSVGLGHARLSIIDTSEKAHQPMTDASGRYTLIFNGEIYNYKDLAESLDVSFTSNSDTEVLLYLLIKEGSDCLVKLNGFFAFAFYDNQKKQLLMARDRMGIKPLHYYQNADFFVFASEMKALLHFPIPRALDIQSLYWYLRLTYLPMEMSILKDIKKLLPGHFLEIKNNNVSIGRYNSLDQVPVYSESYGSAKSHLVQLFEKSVQQRMVADVPLGAFLSGGTDSSAVVSMASKFSSRLNTFSIGYKDHPFFDETHYAELVANQFKTNHTTFTLTNDDLLNSVNNVIEYIDEPFADSSAIPTYILSQKVRQSVTVALSGDGADELFGGYYKHLAFHKTSFNSFTNHVIKSLLPFLKLLPQSRSSKLGNVIRRLNKFGELTTLTPQDKYWRLASFNLDAATLLSNPISGLDSTLSNLFHSEDIDLNEFLDADLKMVLPGDMLTKVDLMSMANSLEVRVPFLDKELVAFARSLPTDYKVYGNYRKRILQDAFEHILPKELHNRSKKGFEVPMLHWLRNELFNELTKTVFDEEFLNDQGIFNSHKIMQLKNVLTSNNPGDVHAVLWTLFVFQKWYKRYLLC